MYHASGFHLCELIRTLDGLVPATAAMPKVGENVVLHSQGCWRTARVEKITKTRIVGSYISQNKADKHAAGIKIKPAMIARPFAEVYRVPSFTAAGEPLNPVPA